uniref:Uncharacterized protein n=1 Tax=Haptolina brevifila TaxID=156173 RepID=A0A7S2CKV4_9EUKA
MVRGELSAPEEQPMFWVLRNQLSELADLGKGDSAHHEDDDRAVVGQAGSCLDTEEVGPSGEERADRGLSHTAHLDHLLVSKGTLDDMSQQRPVYLPAGLGAR